MGDRDRKRGGRRPPPGWGARDTGTELRPPPPELIERLAKTPADPGLPPLDDAEIPSSASGAHGAPGGRWRRPPPPSRTGGAPWPRPGSEPAGAGAPKTAKSPLSTGRANDTMPRLFIPPEEATDPEMVANLAADDEEAEVESADLDLEAEEAPADPHARFDALLAAYAKDFDDDAVRAELEVLADALGRFGELIATAKRLLARTAGTTGEDRVWAQLSRWSKRVHGHESGASPEDRLLDATFAAAPIDGDAPDSVREPPPDFDTFGNNYGSDLRGAEFQSQGFDPAFPIAFDPNFVPFDPSFLGGFPMPAAPAPLGDPLESVADVVDDLDSGELVDDDESVASSELMQVEDVPDEDVDVSLESRDDVAIGPPTEAEGAVRRSSVPRSELPSGSMRARIPTAPPRSERPVDSRTLFVPQAPPPPATEHELPDDVEELDELDSVAEIEPEIEPEPSARPAARPRQSSGDFGAGRSAPPRTTASHAAVRPAEPAAPPPPRRVDPALLKTEEIEAALAKAPNDVERARILVERAKRELAAGDREKAIDSYRDALAFETTNAAALEALERLYRDGKNVVRLVEILEQKLDLAKTDGQRLEGLLAIAELYENDLGDLPGAITRADAAHGLQPKNAKPLHALARAHHKAKDYRAEIEALETLLRGETSRAEKLETLLRIASVQENDQGDPEAAIDTYVRILNEHPQHKAALDDLARLADKTGSWKAKAKILEHKVELAKEPRRQAETLVELGDLLAVADRAPEEARKHYERAARVFPSYPMSWRGLEQLSTWSGDAARAEFYLEQRVRHTQDLAERARVLLELAQFRAVTLNKTAESLAAYELAHKADPTNETAANALIQPFVAQKRWQEAAVLCDVLYRAAVKAEDAARVVEILEISWRVASAMGNRAQMLAVAAARYRLRPEDDALARALLDTAVSQTSQEPLGRARTALELLLSRTGNDGDALGKLGEIFRAAGDTKIAEGCFERVLAESPTDVRALAFLSQEAESRSDFRRAASLKERLARELPSGPDRFQLLLASGDLWLRAKGQVAAALRAYEEALNDDPRNMELLTTLLGLYVDQESWERAAPALRAIADLETDPARKAKTLADLANVLEGRLEDPVAAAEVLEEVLAVDPKRLDAFERLVRVFTKQKDWIALANAYRQMLGRLDDSADPKLAFALNHQLGLVYRDRIGDAERALKSFTQAATLRPDDLDERKIVTELLVVTQRLDAAVDVARATLRKDPRNFGLYRDLYDLFLRAHAYDKAWCVAEAMSVFGTLDETERQFVDDYPPLEPSEIPASLLATAWPTHIHHADLDRTLSSALQIAVAVYLRARLQQAAPPILGVPLDQDPSPEAARVLAAFRNAAEVLACQMPALHGTQVPGPLFTTVLAINPTLSISLATSATVSSDILNFLCTKRLAEQQPALRARSLFPSVQELKQLFFTTTQLATSGAGSMMRPGWDGGLGAVMSPEERAALRGLVAGVASSGQKLDVKRWLQLAEVTAMRAGVLISGSLAAAQRAMQLEPRMPDDLGAQAWLGELGLYAVSEQYFELRETIHVAI